MNKKFKLLFILALVVLGLFALKPTYTWYVGLTADQRIAANESKEAY